MKKKIAMFGSYVADLTGFAPRLPKAGETVFGETFKIGPGGKGSNQAVAAHRADADVTLITKLGKDMFGDMALAFFKKNGIATEHVLIDDEKSTGTALICVDEETGQNQILVVPAACTNFTPQDMKRLEPVIGAADILLVQFEVNMDALGTAMDMAKAAGVTILLNPAPARTISDAMIGMADVVTPNEAEAEALTGVAVRDIPSAKKAADAFHGKGVGAVVITLGKNGVLASDGSAQRHIPARVVEAVDTTGAGDAFNGGLAAALAEGRNIFEAAEFGNALASLSVQKVGTAPSMPYRSEIDAIL